FRQLADPDDASSPLRRRVQFGRNMVPGLWARIGHQARMNQDAPAPGGRPAPDLDRLTTMHEERGPGLSDGQGIACRGHADMTLDFVEMHETQLRPSCRTVT